MDTSWHGTAERGTAWRMATTGAGWSREGAGAPQGCGWLCSAHWQQGPSIEWELGTPHPFSQASWGAWDTRGCSAPVWFGCGLQDADVKCAPGGQSQLGSCSLGPEPWGRGGLIPALAGGCQPHTIPAVRFHPHPSPLAQADVRHSAAVCLPLPFHLPGPLSSREKKRKENGNEEGEERGEAASPRGWHLGSPAPGRDLASCVQLPLPRYLSWGSHHKAVIKTQCVSCRLN